MKISDIRNNKTTVAVVIVLMIFSLPSNLIFITTTEDLTYSSAVQDFYLLPPASLLHYEFTGNQITSQLAVQSSLGVTLQHFSFAPGGPLSPLLSSPSPRLCILNRKHQSVVLIDIKGNTWKIFILHAGNPNISVISSQ